MTVARYPLTGWQPRPETFDPQCDHIWASDGSRVWLVQVFGNPLQFVNATNIKHWMPAFVPAPPGVAAAPVGGAT